MYTYITRSVFLPNFHYIRHTCDLELKWEETTKCHGVVRITRAASLHIDIFVHFGTSWTPQIETSFPTMYSINWFYINNCRNVTRIVFLPNFHQLILLKTYQTGCNSSLQATPVLVLKLYRGDLLFVNWYLETELNNINRFNILITNEIYTHLIFNFCNQIGALSVLYVIQRF